MAPIPKIIKINELTSYLKQFRHRITWRRTNLIFSFRKGKFVATPEFLAELRCEFVNSAPVW
jgi:hypothetical protein